MLGIAGTFQLLLIFALLNIFQSKSTNGEFLVQIQASKNEVSLFQFEYSSAVVRCLIISHGLTKKFGLKTGLLKTNRLLSHQLWLVFVKLYHK